MDHGDFSIVKLCIVQLLLQILHEAREATMALALALAAGHPVGRDSLHTCVVVGAAQILAGEVRIKMIAAKRGWRLKGC